jgi:hypothetical protein
MLSKLVRRAKEKVEVKDKAKQTTPSSQEDKINTTEVRPEVVNFSDGIGPLVLVDNICADSAGEEARGTDIVFVHGPRGTRLGTWSKNGICWPRDLLEKDLNDVRVVSWGYNANITNAFRAASQESIFAHAETLLGDLAQLRNETVCLATFHAWPRTNFSPTRQGPSFLPATVSGGWL